MSTDIPTTAREARAAHARAYFTGRPCPQGHLTTRDTKTQKCTVCKKADTDRQSAKRSEKRRGITGARQFAKQTPIFKIAVHLLSDWRGCVSGAVVA